MTLVQLLFMLIGIAIDIAKQNLSGKAETDVAIGQGTLQLVQVALAAHSASQGLPIEDVIATLKPYVPLAPTKP